MKTPVLLSTLMSLALPTQAQIPNSSFENWSDVNGYDDPDGWISFNGLTDPYGVLVCTQGTPGHTGDWFMQLTTHSIPGFTIVPGVATTADINTGLDGFPCSTRPEALTGWWQHQGPITDVGIVTIIFTKWNTQTLQRDDIGAGYLATSGNQSAWTAFSVPIFYVSPDDPDTASISFDSSGGGVPQDGSTLLIDDLGFDETTNVQDVVEVSPLQVYPSPATDVLNITCSSPITDLRITALDGRVTGPIEWSANTSLDVSRLPAGSYLLQAELSSGIRHMQRFMKQ